ncbi:hypothetical protein N7467_000690 [Penicillium canescens]|nr:hypothetical protein N7467_000690 [Penicillium canescens]
MAWWDSSTPGWTEGLIPNYEQECEDFLLTLDAQITVLHHCPGSGPQLKMLGDDVCAYFPNHPIVTSKPPGYWSEVFPQKCEYLEEAMGILSYALLSDPTCQHRVADEIVQLMKPLDF